jgi:hypothetical protein
MKIDTELELMVVDLDLIDVHADLLEAAADRLEYSAANEELLAGATNIRARESDRFVSISRRSRNGEN